MGKLSRTCVILILAMMAAGCAAPIQYKFGRDLYRRPRSSGLKAVVGVFQDLRTPDEREGTFSATKGYIYTNDRLFRKDISGQVSRAMAKHLTIARMFDSVAVEEIGDLLKSPETMAGLVGQGFDIAVQGDLFHLYGYRSGKNSAQMAAFFGMAGILTEAIANHKVVGGRAAYGDVRFIDLRSGAVIWEGHFNHDFEDKVTFYSNPPYYAVEALKEINNQLTEKLSEVIDGR